MGNVLVKPLAAVFLCLAFSGITGCASSPKTAAVPEKETVPVQAGEDTAKVPVNLPDVLASWIGRPVSAISGGQRMDDGSWIKPLIDLQNEGLYYIFEAEQNIIISAAYRYIGTYAQVMEVQNKLYAFMPSIGKVYGNNQSAYVVGNDHTFWLNFARELGGNLYGAELILRKR